MFSVLSLRPHSIKSGEEAPLQLLGDKDADEDAADGDAGGDAAVLPGRAHSNIVVQFNQLAAAEQVKKDKAKAKRAAVAAAKACAGKR